MASVGNTPAYSYKNLTASANVKAIDGILGGIVCSTSSAGTVTVYDDAGTGTSTPITGTISLTAGQFYNLPFAFSKGLYIVVGGTANITVAYV